ncbi:MAG TPA: aromatic ring-hydroxylating dioxygenase subunit alpha [Rhizomicrobium sp.]|jgi:phenylpropionate dioxygenase-like ring-hydroxylating dioxygenase large terminal subunit|nr:aromatic ring-hydroxylating dioxygenase subunit alpha [Rhizomicrobium sp.]
MSDAAEAQNASAFLRNLWYRAAQASDVRAGRMSRCMLLGEPVLLGRTRDGEAFALRDICPHRGVPLSAGAICADRTVECAYHGWRFAVDGTCRAIPSLVEGQELDPSRIRLRSYPLREQDGQLWIYMTSIGREHSVPAFDPPKVPLPGYAKPRLRETQLFRCAMDHAVLGLMDPAHGPFVHQAWYWRSRRSIHQKAKKFAPSLRGFSMVAHRPSSNSFAYRILGGGVSTEIRFELPGVRFEHIRAGTREVVGLTTCTPVDEETTEVTQTFYWNRVWLGLFKPVFRPFVRAFLSQDRAMVELQREGLKFKPRLMLIQDADVPAMWYHRLKKAWTSATESGGEFINPVPETTLRWRS